MKQKTYVLKASSGKYFQSFSACGRPKLTATLAKARHFSSTRSSVFQAIVKRLSAGGHEFTTLSVSPERTHKDCLRLTYKKSGLKTNEFLLMNGAILLIQKTNAQLVNTVTTTLSLTAAYEIIEND